MSILSQGKRVSRVCLDAIMVTVAMMLSYLEVLLPLNLISPLPGVRLGLANIVVVLVFCLISPIDAAIVSGTRVLLMGLLFGSATSLYFSAMGALLSYLLLLLCWLLGRKCSFVGASVLCAAAHNCGQIIAAATLFGIGVVGFYLPWLLLAAVFVGTVTGLLLNLLAPRIKRFL